MRKLNTNDIRSVAKELIKSSVGGIKFSEIIQKIIEAYPDTFSNTISGTIYNLDVQFPHEIVKPSRGLYVWRENQNLDDTQYKPLASNLIKFPLEIISAEIKIDPGVPVVAFGQAVAYRLFSHKTYVVMPSIISEEDKGRLDSLCMIYGVGFVIFDLDDSNPNFQIRVRAQRFQPDMFFVNDLAEKLKNYDHDKFQKVFG